VRSGTSLCGYAPALRRRIAALFVRIHAGAALQRFAIEVFTAGEPDPAIASAAYC